MYGYEQILRMYVDGRVYYHTDEVIHIVLKIVGKYIIVFIIWCDVIIENRCTEVDDSMQFLYN